MIGPRATRRRTFLVMTRRRKSGLASSYSWRFRTSSGAMGFMERFSKRKSVSPLGTGREAVRLSEDLNGVFRSAARALADLGRGERPVGSDGIRPMEANLFEHRRADLHRERKVFGLHAPGSVVA